MRVLIALFTLVCLAGAAVAGVTAEDVEIEAGTTDFKIRVTVDATSNGTYAVSLSERPGFEVSSPAKPQGLLPGDQAVFVFAVTNDDETREGTFGFPYEVTRDGEQIKSGKVTVVISGKEEGFSFDSVKDAPGAGLLAVIGGIAAVAALRRK